MFPPGFLGSRADILIDIVTLSFIIILPILIFSWRMARNRKDYVTHRRIQLYLGISLFIVVSIFEYDLGCRAEFSRSPGAASTKALRCSTGQSISTPLLDPHLDHLGISDHHFTIQIR